MELRILLLYFSNFISLANILFWLIADNTPYMRQAGKTAAYASEPCLKGYGTMPAFKPTGKSRAAAKALFPSATETVSPEKHGRDAAVRTAADIARGRLRYRSTPFYLKIEGLEGPRPPRYTQKD